MEKRKKNIWKEILAVLFFLGALFFFYQHRSELSAFQIAIGHINWYYISIGIFLTGGYIFLQAALYVFSFYSVNGHITWTDAIILFLKRNVIAVFLPGGGLTALAYLPDRIKKGQKNYKQIHHASVIYGFIGIFSVFIAAIPVLFYLTIQNNEIPGAKIGFAVMFLMLVAIVFLIKSIQSKGFFFRWVEKKWPSAGKVLHEIFAFDLNWKHFWNAVLISLGIEVIGVLHLYISILSIGLPTSWAASVIGYIVATIFLLISPFLRGLGAIELSLTLILKSYGYTTAQALLISLLFRILELWLPLLIGLCFYVRKALSTLRIIKT